MPSGKESSNQNPHIVYNHIDAPFPTSNTLNENNYILWSKVMKMRINGRKMWDTISGAKQNCVEKVVFQTKHLEIPIARYYDELASLFQEIDQRNTMKGESISSIALLQKYVGRLRVHMFLSGLDNVYDQVRGEILRKDPPLTLEQSYQMVRRCSGSLTAKGEDTGKGPSVNTVQSGMKFKSNVFLANSLNNTWLIDTGASDHMVNDSNLLSSVLPSTHTTIYTANGGSSPVIGEGSTDLSKSLSLNSVLIVPALEYNILSVSKITVALKCTVTFWPQFCTFQDIVTRQVLGCGVRKGNLYYLDLTDSGEERIHQVNKVGGIEETKANVWLWHRRLGHLSFGYLQKLNSSLFSNCSVSDFKCDVCELAKSHRTTYSPSFNKSSEPFSIIHSDVWGPARIPSFSGARYFVTFIDECTRMLWVSLITHKSEVFGVFKNFYQMSLTQFKRRIQVFQSDNGGEFTSNEMLEFLTNNGVRHQTSNAYTPQQNGLAEQALKSAAYLINRTPSRVINFKTPFQTLHDLIVVPAMPNLEPRVFGCVVFVHIPKHQRGKLDHCARKCVFLGYADYKKGYRCYDPLEKKVYISLDVSFRELDAYFTGSSLQGEKYNDNEGKFHTGDLFQELENNMPNHSAIDEEDMKNNAKMREFKNMK
ncbi:retrovirus-related pol polyprotein from transposon TNT 1-94 [Tanacetum coccineum]